MNSNSGPQEATSCAATLVSYVEVWHPDADAEKLRLAAARTIGESSQSSTEEGSAVACGEGVAGRAWSQKAPMILQESPTELMDAYSSRSGVSLRAIIAIPVLSEDRIRGVVVLGLADGFGGTEIWSRDDRDELSISSGHYSGLDAFEFINRYVRFPKGAGIPGQVWKTGRPRLVTDPATNEAFVRTFENDPAKIDCVLGVPIGSSSGFATHVLLLLSTSQAPLATRFEIWNCSLTEPEKSESEVSESARLEVTSVESASSVRETRTENARCQRIASDMARERVPLLVDSSKEPSATQDDLLLAIPVFGGKNVTSIWTISL